MDNATLAVLEPKLDAIIRLLAAPIVQGKPISEAAPILAALGLDNSTIAAICGTTQNVVRTARLRSTKGRTRTDGRGKNG